MAALEVTDTTGRILLRGDNPALFGDDKGQVPDVAMALRGQPGIGITLSPATGLLTIGAVVPVQLEGRLVGTLKIAARLTETTARDLGRAAGGEALLFGADRLVAGSQPSIDVAALPAGLRQATTPMALSLPGNGRHLALSSPIFEIGGRPAGHMVIAQSTAAAEAAQE